MTLRIQIDSRYPVSRSASADDFGAIFASANAAEQVAILDAMIAAMEAHPVQWDHIAIELEQGDNGDLRKKINSVFRYITEDQP